MPNLFLKMKLNSNNYAKTSSGDDRRYANKIKALGCGNPFQYNPKSLNYENLKVHNSTYH